MNNSTLKDKQFVLLTKALKTLLVVFIAALLLSLFFTKKVGRTSSLPVLDKNKLMSIVDFVNARQDVYTEGKPDITGFNYGNEEPFR